MLLKKNNNAMKMFLSIAELLLHNSFKKLKMDIFVDAVEFSSKEISIQRYTAEIVLTLLHKLQSFFFITWIIVSCLSQKQ